MNADSPARSNTNPGPVRQTAGCLVVLVILVGIPAFAVHAFVEWTKKPLHQVAERIDDYGTLCDGREIPGAAEYRPGAGPHPVAVFESVQDSEDNRSTVWFDVERRDGLFNPEDPGKVQLVACAERTDVGDVVDSCEFTDGSVDLQSATSSITVYEARTGEQVGEPVEVVGEEVSCPGMVVYKGGLGLYTVPSESQFREVLEPVVGGRP